MSQYPYGFGQYPGLAPPPPLPPNHYAYPNPGAYPPASSYGSPQDPNAPAPTPNYYAMTQSAYDYNSSIPGIPGLGIGGTPAAGTPYQPPPPLPPASAWGHHVHQAQFAASTPDASSLYQYSAPAQFNGPADRNYQQPPSYNTQSLPPPAAPAPIPHLPNEATQSSDEMEEGELSEGQFEDLYEPVDSAAKSKDTTVSPSVSPMQQESQPTSAAETPTGGFYANDEEDSDGQDQSKTGAGAGASARERSGSYSPYLSPREIHIASTPNNPDHGVQGIQKANVKVGKSSVNARARDQVPALGPDASTLSTSSQGAPTTKSATSQNPTTNGNRNDTDESPEPLFKSLADARKEAQKAILKLWSHGVRSEDYIKEGIDEKVVKGLFADLHLDFSTGKPVQPEAAPPAQQRVPSEPRPAPPAISKSPSTERKTLAQPQSGSKPPEGNKMDKSEERKDRIARLLALKAAKGSASAPVATVGPAPGPVAAQAPVLARPTAPAVNPTPALGIAQPQVPSLAPSESQPPAAAAVLAQPSAPAQTTIPVGTNPTPTAMSSATSTPTGPKPKTKTKEEMERLLRQKMEALQKSRELNAKKAESDKTPSSSVKGAGAEAVISRPSAAVSVNQPARIASPQEQSNQDKGPIPGLFLSSNPQASQPVNVRKRPVASDFVDYPAADSLKRPFGQKRQNSSLVIDVSDASDDEDMDIDMDMDSPDETPLPIPRSNTPGRKGPSLAEFPPLRDLSRRNVSSPAPSTSTPPALMSTKDRELEAKERAIQEMKRKIAELEAKKKALKGSQTPNQGTSTPSEGNDSESSSGIAPRAPSVAADKVDAASAQLISEAASAKLPKASEPGRKEDAQTERHRSVSVNPSRAKALEEKKKQLVALKEAREAKQREAEERWRAEQARLAQEEARIQEEEAKLQAELEQGEETEHWTDEEDRSEQMSVDEGSEEDVPKVDEEKQSEETQSVASPEDSLAQTQDKQQNLAAPTSETDAREKTQAAAAEQSDFRMSMEEHESTVSQAHGDSFADKATADTTTSAGQPVRDSGYRVAVPDSPDFSPEPAGDLSSNVAGEQHVPATISDVPRSRAETQEIEGPVVSEPERAVAPRPNSTFVPYESPLRYFRAFRFHPEFKKVVPGGVKSLTYSNKIDPRKELCPDELQGGTCPRGNACGFQHLNDIRVSDEQILVELGKSDDYTGEQRDRFIQGLKDLLQDFRAKKTRDFDTIANGIIEFRARFLGDKSKILPLDGVTL